MADGLLSVVGSTYLDFRSFHFNAECNLVIFDEATASRFTEAFLEDLSLSSPVQAEAWRRRPFLHRLGDSAAKSLGPLL